MSPQNLEEPTEEKAQQKFVYRIFGTTLGAVIVFLLEVLQIVLIAAVVIVPIRIFLIKPFVVKGASMEPSFYNDEYLIIDEISYRFREIKRGETVVFVPPTNESQFYIKRVVGLPGETVEVIDGDIIIYNAEHPDGIKLQEDYTDEYTLGRMRVELGEEEFFLVGDNRDASYDSRNIGPINAGSIVGRAWIRGFPLNKAGLISIPDYQF